MRKYICTIILIIVISSCSSSNFEFDPGACPRAAIMKGSESSSFNGLGIELNRTVMICEYNVRKKKIDFNVGIIGDIIGGNKNIADKIDIPLFIAFVGPNDVVIDKWIKNNTIKVSSNEISSFSIGIENLRSDIQEGRTGSSYKVLIGIQK
ncbi:hypothetical protein N9S49_00575 [Rhodobiaceae bacterium]|jgi:hypothetical protein|nr:hypothetical protein [Rhodobiaceae bacterium]|tara:strand:- start:98 stop:550 length:453 start_codon:yes stop_codon:yes gene_type:complete